MFAQSHSPEQLTPHELDAYLARGWFRMGQTIFTTNFVRFKGEMYSTVWLCILLDDYLEDRTQTKLFKRNSIFRTSVQPALLNIEKEELYLRYQQSLPFHTSESLQHLLFGNKDTPSIYLTYEVTVHDGDRLIAIGFFDIGETSAAGITSVYDPSYKKYSLGKYLIYLKIQHCKNLKLRYFYPGYFVPGYSYFDYKLTLCRQALRFLQLSTQQWHNIEAFSPENIPYQVMNNQLLRLQKLLSLANLESNIVNYEYFDANLIPELREAELFNFLVFLYCPNQSVEDMHLVVVFDIRDARYHLQTCIPFWQPNEVNPDSTFYSTYILKKLLEIHVCSLAEEMASVFLKSVVTKN